MKATLQKLRKIIEKVINYEITNDTEFSIATAIMVILIILFAYFIKN